MTTRTATPADYTSVLAIFNEAITEKRNAYIDQLNDVTGLKWFGDLHRNSFEFLVCEVDNAIAGWGNLSPYRKGRGALSTTAEITFYVSGDHRRKGVATAIITALHEAAKMNGFQHLIAILLGDNAPSEVLLGNLGYTVWGRLDAIAHFDDGDRTHIYMGKHL